MTITRDSDSPKTSSDRYFEAIITQDIATLQACLETDPQDLLLKVSLASALETADHISEALRLYQEVATADPNGLWGQSARKALTALEFPGEVGLPDQSSGFSTRLLESMPKPLPTQGWFGLGSSSARKLQSALAPLESACQQFLGGDYSVRVEEVSEPQVMLLAEVFNRMAEQINTLTAKLTELEQQRQSDLATQKQERSRMQESVINLLLDIEGAQRGDLTVRATVDEGEMGSIADAFNATVLSLREIVVQVQAAANQVQDSALRSDTSVQQLSQDAQLQAQEVAAALNSVEEIGTSIQAVARSAQEAAVIAHQSLVAAKEGTKTMDQTVDSIENIRTSVADTSKKVKRLAESSQEISKIVSIISGISEKTNLLAFNASIEAARAGENGQGFRVVADEVRRLAERVTDSTQEIEQLVSSIQGETAAVLQTMESSTAQVVQGTKLVAQTKQTLVGLAQISQKIDRLLQTISASTVSQTEASRLVNETMQEVAAIAQTSSGESMAVATAMQALVEVATHLQNSVSRFQIS